MHRHRLGRGTRGILIAHLARRQQQCLLFGKKRLACLLWRVNRAGRVRHIDLVWPHRGSGDVARARGLGQRRLSLRALGWRKRC